jgi:hypothetical protein
MPGLPALYSTTTLPLLFQSQITQAILNPETRSGQARARRLAPLLTADWIIAALLVPLCTAPPLTDHETHWLVTIQRCADYKIHDLYSPFTFNNCFKLATVAFGDGSSARFFCNISPEQRHEIHRRCDPEQRQGCGRPSKPRPPAPPARAKNISSAAAGREGRVVVFTAPAAPFAPRRKPSAPASSWVGYTQERGGLEALWLESVFGEAAGNE